MKKKITKKTLDELRKTMPVLSEEEMSKVNGSVMYYNQSGVYIGKIGDSDELRFVGDVPFSDILRQVTNNMAAGSTDTLAKRQEAAALNIGTNWSSTSQAARIIFVTNLINNDPSLSRLKGMFIGDHDQNSGVRPAIIGSGANGDPVLGISTNQLYFGSYTSLASTLVHEASHVGPSGTIVSNEFDAYKAQANNSYYKNASLQYQLAVARGAVSDSNWMPRLYDKEARLQKASEVFGLSVNQIRW